MTQPDQIPVFSHALKPADLPPNETASFLITPDAAACAQIAGALGIEALRKLRFEGHLAPAGRHDWRLTAHLGATVVQSCVVTLAPVTTRLEEDVARIWRHRLPEPEPGTEVEMPEDTDEEQLRSEIDLGRVMVEALTLALPLYPRADAAHLDEDAFAAPGVAPMRDEDARPFAGLAGLRDQLTKEEGPDGDA